MRTSGKETYGAGRFMYVPLPVNGKVPLDFNKAYNPPCAFNDFATCPLPPPQNRLSRCAWRPARRITQAGTSALALAALPHQRAIVRGHRVVRDELQADGLGERIHRFEIADAARG